MGYYKSIKFHFFTTEMQVKERIDGLYKKANSKLKMGAKFK